MAYTLTKHLRYNAWANQKIADVLTTIDSEIYFRDNHSSFPSIAKTVQHLWSAQDIWIRRMHGQSQPSSIAAGKFTRSEVLEGLTKSSNDLVTFVDSKDEIFLESKYSYLNLKGQPFSDPYEDTLFHIVNHGSYHRGQVISMLRESGIDKLPGTDLIHYLRTLNQ